MTPRSFSTARSLRSLLAFAVIAALVTSVGPAAGLDGDSDGDTIADAEDLVTSSGTIISRDQPTRQSSDYKTSTPAERAVDGSYDGTSESFNTHTQADGEPWWEVDLGRTYTIDSINVWNRNSISAGVNARLDGAAVIVTAEPLGDVSFAEARRRAVWSTVIHDAGLLEQVAVPDRIGRYVRIQLPTNSFLHLAEVDVMGTPGRPNDIDGDLVIDAEDTVDTTGVIVSTAKLASQSSTWTGQPNTDAAAAVNDIRDGGRDGSQAIAITDDDEPWWQVDLEGWYAIDGINIYNRTDGGQELLTGAVVMIASTPFNAAMGLSEAQAHATHQVTIDDASGLIQLAIPDTVGRYVRIQHAAGGTPHLGLAEVDVIANPSEGDVDADGVPDVDDIHHRMDPNVALSAAAAQSSTYRSSTPAGRAIDGNHDGSTEALNNHTACASQQWWEVDLGSNHTIEGINVWNRNSTSAAVNARLNGASVIIATIPLGLVSHDDAVSAASWTGTITTATRVNQFEVPDVVGRYVRVQLPGTNCLHLAEVDVFATPEGDVGELDRDDDADGIIDRVDEHVSVHGNVSTDQPATQSSTYQSSTPASRAVDGNRDGSTEALNNHTACASQQWWEVDLGADHTIDNINIWNRNSTSATVNARLDGATVILSTTPLGSVSHADAVAAATWTGTITTATRTNQFTIPDVVARYVRVQLPGTNCLHLAEVDVFGTPTGG